MPTNPHIAFIGAGHMGSSLIGGLLKNGFTADEIRAADPDAAQRERIASRFRVPASATNYEAASGADIVVLAVKPQVMCGAVQALAGRLAQSQPLVISIAAGIREPDLRRWLGFDAAIVRAMPNMAALVGAGAAALYANTFVTAPQRVLAQRVLEAAGTALWVQDENLMDAVTAVSGSGPAYFFLLMELLEAAARELGIPPNLACALSQQTAYGAACLVREGATDAGTLRRQVTSPGGTTAAALRVLENARLAETFACAVRAACERSRALAREFGQAEP